MLFNSLEFILFFPLVYSAYLISNRSWQNRILLIASYFFYASWDWRFLCLLLFSTVLDYVCGLKIHQSDLPRDKKKFLIFSLVGNLAVLAFFKYFNFFSESFYSLMKGLGWTPDPITLNIILPIGISFYTFQTLSYTIDIYKGKLEPTKHFYNFALFVSFFPQLVAGPIERARNLLPQIENKRNITPDHIRDGILLIIWGYFLKVFVADNLLKSAYLSFHAEFPYNGFDIFLANYAYTFVILCDFAGYSNIARGLGKLMGFEISINFHAPYFAPNPIVFWERWHISLTSWIKDYVYAPLRKKYSAAVSILLTFAAIGLWHGGKWNYVIWGVLHGLIILIYRYIVFKKKWRRREDELKPSFSYWMKVCLMYHLSQNTIGFGAK